MFKSLKKISNRTIIICIFLFNLMILGSFLFYILIGSNLLSSNLLLLAYPAKILSENIFYLVFFFVFEFLSIGYFWNKKLKTKNSVIDKSVVNLDVSNLETIDESLVNDIPEIIYEVDEIDSNLEKMDVFEYDSNVLEFVENDEENISPSFFSPNETTLVEKSQESLIEFADKIISDTSQKNEKPNNLINDFQYSFYQTIIQNEWLYEKSMDRERIGLDKYAIDEAKISLNDLNELIKAKLIRKNTIPHPTGSFSIITAKKDIELLVVNEIIKKFLASNRMKFNQKRFEFQNWNEFGLQKKCWEFDFVLEENNIVICLLISNNNQNNNEQNLETLDPNEKELIKALIAIIELKLNSNGTALIITNSKDRMQKIDRFVTSTGWGEVVLLDFSDENFFNELQFFL